MNSQVAEKLIIMGAILILAPIVSDYLMQRQVVEVMTATKATNVSLGGGLSTDYRTSCYIAGAVMIGVAILRSWSSGRVDRSGE